MTSSPSYALAVQAKLVASLVVVHNFIEIHNPEDSINNRSNHATEPEQATPDAAVHATEIPSPSRLEAEHFRDQIAQQMWQDYQEILQRRREKRNPSIDH